jgi:hypothetical protein
MKPLFAIIFLSLTPVLAVAQTSDDSTLPTTEPGVMRPGVVDLQQFVWKNRPVIVLADSPNDPRFEQQMNLLNADLEALAKRDVVVLTDTDPDANSPLREKLHPRGFMLVLIGKDGMIKLRKPFPWDVRELSRTIDKMPMRQQEIRDRRGLN